MISFLNNKIKLTVNHCQGALGVVDVVNRTPVNIVSQDSVCVDTGT